MLLNILFQLISGAPRCRKYYRLHIIMKEKVQLRKNEKPAQNYSVSNWFEVESTLSGFWVYRLHHIRGCLSVRGIKMSPSSHFTASHVDKPFKQPLQCIHSNIILTMELNHSKKKRSICLLITMTYTSYKYFLTRSLHSTNIHTQQLSIYPPYILLRILRFAEQIRE